MADYTNPFSENYREEDPASNVGDGECIDGDEAEKNSLESAKVNADAVAEYLLHKKHILTALELHMELLESGKELPRLRNYFSNPANFEQQGNGTFEGPSSLYRTGSISTFDSLDLTRGSDDGTQHDDRVAVLEFELRKANETIKNLRMSLTGTLEEDSFLKSDGFNGDSKKSKEKTRPLSLSQDETESNPLVKRALNYLINEYLLRNNYKLASITLADEIEDQDFEDWDDVGLNMPKPPNLLKLFKEFSSPHLHNHKHCDVGVGTGNGLLKVEESLKSMKEQCEKLEKENFELTQLVTELQNEASSAQSVISSTPRNKSFEENLDDDFNADNDKNPVRRPVQDSTSYTDSKFLTAFNTSMQKDIQNSFASVNDKPSPSRMSPEFWNKLFYFWQDDSNNDECLAREVAKIASSNDEMVTMLSSSLPRIVPTVDVEKRDQLVPLLLSSAAMQSDAEVRNVLLRNLFNLIEKPGKSHRLIILAGCAAYARAVGTVRTEEDLLPQFWEQIGHKDVERRHLVAEACGTIAPFLRPEMRNSLLLSILQQMEQEESTEQVQRAIIRSLSILVALLDDDDKYGQAFRMVCDLTRDKRPLVQLTARKYLLPSFACWSRISGKLCNHLIDHFLRDAESIVFNEEGSRLVSLESLKFLQHLENLQLLLPFLYADILLNIPQQYRQQDVSVFAKPAADFHDGRYSLYILFEAEEQYTSLFSHFNSCIGSADLENWESLSFCLCILIPRLLKIVKNIHPKHQDCVSALCELFSTIVSLFGIEFVRTRLKDQRSQLFYMEGEEDVTRDISFENTPLTSAAVAVYSCGVLAACGSPKEKEELNSFLNDTLITLATCHAPLQSLEAAVVEIRKQDSFHETILDVLWQGAAHPSAFVRTAAAVLFTTMAVKDVSYTVLSTRILPALLTLSKDKDESVQTATIRAFGALIECPQAGDEIIDRVVAQFSSFMIPADGSSPHHPMNVEMVRMIAEVTPKADPRFCNEFVLPHLAAIAAKNNQEANKTKRSDIALEMLKGFTNISFCYIPDSLLQSAFIPGLRCLLQDMERIHPEHVVQVEKLIKDNELKLEQRAPVMQVEAATTPASDKTKNSKPKFYSKLF